MKTFSTERQLFEAVLASDKFRDLLQANPAAHILIEPKGLFGVPDILLANLSWSDDGIPDLQTIAFELKRTDWRRALRQAFRYRSFSQKSFVVVDAACAHSAINNLSEFQNFNVGLITIDTNATLQIYFDPHSRIPYSPRQEMNLRLGLLDLVTIARENNVGECRFVLQDLRFAAIG